LRLSEGESRASGKGFTVRNSCGRQRVRHWMTSSLQVRANGPVEGSHVLRCLEFCSLEAVARRVSAATHQRNRARSPVRARPSTMITRRRRSQLWAPRQSAIEKRPRYGLGHWAHALRVHHAHSQILRRLFAARLRSSQRRSGDWLIRRRRLDGTPVAHGEWARARW
jgi:hypothetical protein